MLNGSLYKNRFLDIVGSLNIDSFLVRQGLLSSSGVLQGYGSLSNFGFLFQFDSLYLFRFLLNSGPLLAFGFLKQEVHFIYLDFFLYSVHSKAPGLSYIMVSVVQSSFYVHHSDSFTIRNALYTSRASWNAPRRILLFLFVLMFFSLLMLRDSSS